MKDGILFRGERMKALRERRHMSQETLSELMGVSRTQITNLENGNSEPSLRILISLAVHFQTSTDYLLGVEVKKYKKHVEPLPFDE